MKEKRSPTSHRTPSQHRAHTAGYQATPKAKKARAQSNAARAKMIAAGKAKKGDGKDVAHKNPISKGGTNAMSNLTVQSKAKNRGHGMTKGAKANKGKKGKRG